MSDADRTQAELQAITAGYQLGRPVGALIPLAPPLTSAQEERVRELIRQELASLLPARLPVAPEYRGEPCQK